MSRKETSIEINSVKNQAKQIKKIREDYEQLMRRLNNVLNATQSNWQGYAFNVFRQKYERTEPVLTKFGIMLEVLSKTMENVAQSYEISDEAMAQEMKKVLN